MSNLQPSSMRPKSCQQWLQPLPKVIPKWSSGCENTGHWPRIVEMEGKIFSVALTLTFNRKALDSQLETSNFL